MLTASSWHACWAVINCPSNEVECRAKRKACWKMAADREEQLLLRVQNPDLAERLHAVLSEKADAPKDPTVELRFDGDILHTMRHLENELALQCKYHMSVLACVVAVMGSMATVTDAMQRTAGGGEGHSPLMERSFQQA